MRGDVEERYRRRFVFSSAFPAPADHERRHVAHGGAVREDEPVRGLFSS